MTSFWTFVYKQVVTSYYPVKLPPFLTKLRESPSLMGHALVSSGDFPLHCDLRVLFRISGWSASSSLSFTWYLLNAESIYGPFLNDVCYGLSKNWAPPFLLLQRQRHRNRQSKPVTPKTQLHECWRPHVGRHAFKLWGPWMPSLRRLRKLCISTCQLVL